MYVPLNLQLKISIIVTLMASDLSNKICSLNFSLHYRVILEVVDVDHQGHPVRINSYSCLDTKASARVRVRGATPAEIAEDGMRH